MKIPTGRPPSPWPKDKQGVIDMAWAWLDPDRVSIDNAVIASLELPDIVPGADPSMAAGKLGSFREDITLSIALNSINYQFWDLRDGGFIRYEFEGKTGATGMRAAFERAWADPAGPMSRARAGIPMSEGDIAAMFGQIPHPESRARILNEVLSPPRLEGLAASLDHDLAGGVDTAMAHRLAEEFPLAYGDKLLKKAQLAISEVWVKTRAGGLDVGCDLTAFADYQIPNILRAMGVLNYEPSLAARIDNREPLISDSPDEKAIRAASILAVERIAEGAGLPVAAVDHYLWMRRNEAKAPFHLTFTTSY